jgi:PAS domain S-box-containing protein
MMKMPSLAKHDTGEAAGASPQIAGRRYEAVLRISEALSQCREPEDLTTILAEELREFLAFLQFYIVVYKENSDDVEWAVVGREKSLIAAYADVPVQERPSWQAYKTQEPFYIHDWDTDERVPAQFKKGIAAQGLEVGPLVFVPLTTPHRRLGALGMSGPAATVYTNEDISFLQLIGRVVALRLSDSFNLRQAEGARLELERQNDRLRRAERELREVIETIPCMAWSATADGNAEFFNRRWLDYAGLTADQARGTGWTTALHPNDLSGLVDYWQRILTSSRPGEFEARLRRFDGEYRWLLFRATPSLDENGKVIKWYGTNIDIEERKRAEQDLRRSEAHLAEAQRLTQTGSCAIHGTSRETLYWSEEMFRLFGFDPQQGLPKLEQWVQRIHPEDHDKFKLASDRTLLKKVDCDIKFRIVKPDGTVRHIHGIGHPVLSPNGELVQVVGTMVDITERMHAEEALKRSETYLAQAQRVANIGSWVFDTVRMKPVHLSTEWHRLQDFDPKDGMPTWEKRLQRIHPEDRARYQEAFNCAIAEKSDLDAEFRILLPNSTVRYIRSVGHPVLDALGEVTQMMGVIMDVTESRQAEQEHNRLQQELAHLSHLNRVSTIGELTASLAHEIKQPIGAAVTNAQACLRFLDGGRLNVLEAREAALEMARDATRAADIIDRVRSLYRKDSSHQEMVDVNDLIREMIVMLRDEANRHSVTTRTDLAEGLPKVMADRVQLQQALMNLMLNGIEAMRDTTGELSIQSRLAEEHQLLISVTDAGVGLPTEKADQIFNAFFTTKPQGTGLGLAITRSIIESHGGRVWATPNSGPGVTFHFTLPRDVAVAV